MWTWTSDHSGNPETLASLSLSLSLSLSRSLSCWSCWCIALASRHRSHVTHGSCTRSYASVYHVTWTDHRYLAVWTFSNYTLHRPYICKGTWNCPVVLVTCWHPSQIEVTLPKIEHASRPLQSVSEEVSIFIDWCFNEEFLWFLHQNFFCNSHGVL